MSVRLENDEAKITMALKNKSLNEIDEIIEHVIQFKKDLLQSVKQEEDLEKLINERSIDNKHVRVAIKRTKFQREPKYQFTDPNGKPQTWAGVGKMPLALKELITVNGKEDKTLLDKYLIKPKGSVVKYQFVNANGMIETWDGKGTMAVNLRVLTLKGFKLEQFEIKEH